MLARVKERVQFVSNGLELAGVLQLPDGLKKGERRAAFLVLHGFGSNKDGGNVVTVSNLLTGLGYATLRFDMRGCGDSQGARGRTICLAPGSILEFPFDVVESMYAFRANDVVGKIAPRPLLLLHPANDTVTPTEQSVDLFALAGQPTDLHLVAGVDHFMFSEGNTLVINLLRDWLALHFSSR